MVQQSCYQVPMPRWFLKKDTTKNTFKNSNSIYLSIIQLLQTAFFLCQMVSSEGLTVHLLGGFPQPLLQTFLIPSQVESLLLPPHIFHHHGLLLLTCLVTLLVCLRLLRRAFIIVQHSHKIAFNVTGTERIKSKSYFPYRNPLRRWLILLTNGQLDSTAVWMENKLSAAVFLNIGELC